MLCRINATIGATDVKAQTINLLRCLQAVCTASAGSTPSVQPVTAPSTFGTGDCIVEVISNAEAGGWTSSSSTTVTTGYSATNATAYYVDLYNSSGKTTYPYHKVTFSSNQSYPFSNASFAASYPFVDMFIGFHTATTMDGNYSSGFTSYGTSQAADNFSGFTGRSITAGVPVNSPTGAATDTTRGLRAASGEFLVASTANYVIIIGANGMYYFGVRSNAAWENAYTNNPYVAGFAYNCYSTSSALSATHTAVSSSNQLAVFGYGVDSTGTVSPASPRWRHGWYNITQGTAAYYNFCPITGGGGTLNNAYPSWGYGAYCGFSGPIMPFGLRSGNGNTMVGPSTDTATGANVPPAYPIVVNYSGSTNNWQIPNISALTGMVLPGLYRSLAGSDAFMNQYYTAGTTYVVGTENYYPYTVGNNTGFKDLMLIRKY
jgi:hypothetical protein